MKSKRLLTLIGGVCLALVLTVLPFVGACAVEEAPAPAPAPAPTPTPTPTPTPSPEAYRIKWGSTSVRSGLYAGTVAEAKAVNDAYRGEIECTVIETGGYIENLVRLQKGLVDVGIACAGAGYSSYKGIIDFKVADPNLRSFGPTYVTPLNFLARKDRGITRLEDYEGKKLATLPGGSSDRTARFILEANGITADYQWMGMGASIEAMKAGTVDGYLKAGYRDSAILDIASATEIVIVPVTREHAEKLWEAYPGHGLIHREIPAGLYPGQDEPVVLCWYSPTGFISKDVPEDIVYKIIKVLYEQREAIAEPLAYLDKGDYVNMWELTKEYQQVPLHPGSVRFFEEQGFEIPARLIPPEMK